MKQTSKTRRGDTVIWLQGGQPGTEDGLPAVVHKVYPGGTGVDLVVIEGVGNTVRHNVVPHESDRDNTQAGRVLREGLWRSIEDHHEVYEKEEAARLKKLETARKAKSAKDKSVAEALT